MPTNTLSFTEPHPSVPKTGAFLSGGRGGAGNYRKYSSSELSAGPNASGPASCVPLARPFHKNRVVPGGRGGRGNMISTAAQSEEPSMFQFDEDLLRKRGDVEAPVYRIGRGGAGNHFSSSSSSSSALGKPSTERKGSSESVNSERSEKAVSMSGLNPLGAIRRNSTLSMFSRRSS